MERNYFKMSETMLTEKQAKTMAKEIAEEILKEHIEKNNPEPKRDHLAELEKKRQIMSVKDHLERQRLIRENIELFR